MFLVNFSQVQQSINNFLKNAAILTKKVRTNLTADTYQRLFQQKTMFLWKKLWLFLLFPWDKGDYVDVWMIKIMIEINQIYMDVCFFQM